MRAMHRSEMLKTGLAFVILAVLAFSCGTASGNGNAAFNDRDSVRIQLGPLNGEQGIKQLDIADGCTVVAVAGDKECRRTDEANGCYSMYFDVDDGFARGGKNDFYVTVEYFDRGNDGFYLRYDSAEENIVPLGIYKYTERVLKTGTDTWLKHTFHLPDARFDNRQRERADFHVSSTDDGGDEYIRSVTISRSAPETSKVISAVKYYPSVWNLSEWGTPPLDAPVWWFSTGVPFARGGTYLRKIGPGAPDLRYTLKLTGKYDIYAGMVLPYYPATVVLKLSGEDKFSTVVNDDKAKIVYGRDSSFKSTIVIPWKKGVEMDGEDVILRYCDFLDFLKFVPVEGGDPVYLDDFTACLKEMPQADLQNLAAPSKITVGQPFKFAVTIKSMCSFNADRPIVVNVINEKGEITRLGRCFPDRGTSSWKPGESVTNNLEIAIPLYKEVATGNYALAVELEDTTAKKSVRTKIIKEIPLADSWKQTSVDYSGKKPLQLERFVDRYGVSHGWYVNSANTLIWDGKPWYPVGGYAHGEISDFERLKRHGVTDVYIRILSPRNDQEIINYLDDNGFSYGVILQNGQGDLGTWGMNDITGYLVKGSAYRYDNIRTGGIKKRSIKVASPAGGLPVWLRDDTKVLYALFDKATGELTDVGYAVVSDISGMQATVSVDVKAEEGHVYTLYFTPMVTTWNANYRDYWQGYPEAKDKLVDWLKQFKFGRGLRFLETVMFWEQGFDQDIAYLLPATPEFRSLYADWLRKKYATTEDMNSSWAIEGKKIESFGVAARLIPVGLTGERGYLYDEETGGTYGLRASASQLWDDFLEFRQSSISEINQKYADAIKSEAFNVPVGHRICPYANRNNLNMREKGGEDLILMDVYGYPETLLRPMLLGYSLAEQSRRNQCYMVGETKLSPGQDVFMGGHKDIRQLFDNYDAFFLGGAKGIFELCLLKPKPEQHGGSGGFSYRCEDPGQMDWLRMYKELLYADNKLDNYKPTVYFSYPTVNEGRAGFISSTDDYTGSAVGVGMAPNGAFVVPTYNPYVDEVLIVNLADKPASVRYSGELEDALRKRKQKTVFTGFRKDLGAISPIDKYYTPEYAENDEGRSIQVLKPSAGSMILYKTKSGKVWGLEDGNLQIISLEKNALDYISDLPPVQYDISRILNRTWFSIGDNITGYLFSRDGNPAAYLWSTGEKQKVTLAIPSGRNPKVIYRDGRIETPVGKGSRKMEFSLTGQPVCIEGLYKEDIQTVDVEGRMTKPVFELKTAEESTEKNVRPAIKNLRLFSEQTRFILDGDLSEWKDRYSVALKNPAASGNVRFMWDSNNLYIGADVSDRDVIQGNPQKFWLSSGLEIFIDVGYGRKAGEYDEDVYHFWVWPAGPEGTGASAGRFCHRGGGVIYPLEEIECKSKVTKEGYTLEIRIPGSSLKGYRPLAGGKMGINLFLNGGKTTACWIGPLNASFAGSDTTNEDPSQWGDLIFVEH